MYEFLDQPVERLCNGGRFLLWAMRGWTQAMASATCPPVALSRGFAGFDVLAALPDFHVAMALLNRESRTPIALAPMNCTHIAEDEAVLVGLWRDLVREQDDHVWDTLALIAEKAVAPAIARAMSAAMGKFVAAGLDMSGFAREDQKESK